MGIVQSVPTEAALVIGVGAAALGARYYASTLEETKAATTTAPLTSQATKKGKKGKKSNSSASASVTSTKPEKEKAPAPVAPVAPEPQVVKFPAVVSIPGALDASANDTDASIRSASKTKKKKTKSKKAAASGTGGETSDASQAGPSCKPPVRPSTLRSTSLLDNDDEPWTKVARKQKATSTAAAAGTGSKPADGKIDSLAPVPLSDAGVTTSATGTTTPTTERTDEDEEATEDEVVTGSSQTKQRTLAEKLLPKPRKTGVEDMLDTPDQPSLSRVMRVAPTPGEKPADGFSWGDYEDVRNDGDADREDDGGGWSSVKSKRTTSSNNSGQATKPPTQSSSSASNEPLSKKARQNQRKKEEAKAAKAEGEADRLARQAQQRAGAERARLAEQLHANNSKSRRGVGSGMSVSVDDNNHSIYD